MRSDDQAIQELLDTVDILRLIAMKGRSEARHFAHYMIAFGLYSAFNIFAELLFGRSFWAPTLYVAFWGATAPLAGILPAGLVWAIAGILAAVIWTLTRSPDWTLGAVLLTGRRRDRGGLHRRRPSGTAGGDASPAGRHRPQDRLGVGDPHGRDGRADRRPEPGLPPGRSGHRPLGLRHRDRPFPLRCPGPPLFPAGPPLRLRRSPPRPLRRAAGSRLRPGGPDGSGDGRPWGFASSAALRRAERS
jgi:hypothetical protein